MKGMDILYYNYIPELRSTGHSALVHELRTLRHHRIKVQTGHGHNLVIPVSRNNLIVHENRLNLT